MAQHLGAEALFVFVRAAERGALVAAPGLTQTHPEDPTWRDFLAACAQPGVHKGELLYPEQRTLRPATALVLPDGTAFVFLGEQFAIDSVSDSALPLVAALLRAEQAKATAAAAGAKPDEVRPTSTLTATLTATRAELQRALDEVARLNRELQNSAAGERAAIADAEDANRAKDEFLAMLGHELRNPLAPILTALQLMKLRGDLGSAHEQEIIERQITHVIGLVDDLLDISRITRGKAVLKKAPVELAQVVAKAVEQASPLLEKHQHQFTATVAPSGLLLDVDEARLTQVVANLLTNAARYTPPGGEIALRVRRDEKGIELIVSDSGIGIEAEMLPHLFELFFQGKRGSDRAGGGLGLGLALVQTLVAMHGGTVSAHSEGRGRGSQFVVRLPAQLHVTAAPVAPPIKRAAAPAHAARLRVLVVDDNVDAVALIADALRMHGHEVVVAHDGPSALSMLQNFHPEVAVLDIGLPVMDGYELAQKLRSGPGGRAMRLVAMTGYGQPSDIARAKAAGFDRHLVKPVRLAELLGALVRPVPVSEPVSAH